MCPEAVQETDIDNFCGWHLDHGALTVLLSPMYLDSNGNKVPSPSEGGLFIKNANGVNVKVTIPEDCLAVQLGELGQLYSAQYGQTGKKRILKRN